MRRVLTALAAVMACAALGSPSAQAAFGLHGFEVSFSEEDGSTAFQAGSHPFAMSTSFALNTKPGDFVAEVPDGEVKNLAVAQIPGFVGNPTATPRCSTLDFITRVPGTLSQEEIKEGMSRPTSCPDATAVGTVAAELEQPGGYLYVPVFNLEPPPGVAAKLGFVVLSVPVTIEIGVNETAPHNVVASLVNVPQPVRFYGSTLTLWGNPTDSAHDSLRGVCVAEVEGSTPEVPSRGKCPVGAAPQPFLTLPRACEGPLQTTFVADSWQSPGAFVSGSATTPGFSGCERLGFAPQVSARPTNRSAESPTGLDFDLDIADPGLANPDGLAASDVRRAVVTLPEGVTINPSQAEGLGTCSQADLERERAVSTPGGGCPQTSKIGTVEVETPLLEGEILRGALYVAEPYRNPFGSLIALYMTIKHPGLGISISLAGKVEPDPETGQLVTTFGDPSSADPDFRDLPQLPFSHFRLRFREGGRSPLVTPPTCGSYAVVAEFIPWSGGPAHSTSSQFEIVAGAGACPAGGVPPFAPGFEAGTESNQAGSYSPFLMRLTRADGEQDLTRFSATLPPGVLGRLAGIPYCSEVGIARAASRTGAHGGAEERDDPSCPAASRIGRTLAGAGVGSELTYVPGSLYLAGPYRGRPLSVVAITPALAGPFDAGTVVVREALKLNPTTGQVEVDGSASDPIPHILKGIPLKLRELRVYADRPNFTLNSTSCEPSTTAATLFGGFLDVFSPADDVAIERAARYQAAGCRALGFKPRLVIRLRGGTARGAHPALRAVVRPRAEDANFSRAVVTLPRSAFLDQAHIRTICTRVQFGAGQGNGAECPKGAIYGRARAWSPLLDEPLRGPVFLRSSNNNLPDLVVALRGIVDIELAARIDSVRGGIRSTFAGIPDAPVSRFILDMQGGKKGLIVNSRNLCFKPRRNRARANLVGQNGRRHRTRPLLRARCAKKHQRHKTHRRGRERRAGR